MFSAFLVLINNMRKHITKALAIAAIAFVSSLGSIARADDYVPLIDSNGIPPLVTPQRSIRLDMVSSNLSSLFDWLQPHLVKMAVDQEFNRVAKAGLTETARLGQAGVLLKVRISTATIGTQTFYYPVGTGVLAVGIGPSPDAVCFAQQCYNTISPQPAPGTQLSNEDSRYVWLEPVGGGKVVQASHYNIEPLERRAQLTFLNQSARNAYRNMVSAQYFAGYATQLSRIARGEADRKTVLVLLQSKAAAEQKILTVETELNKQLDKAKRGAKAAAIFDVLSGVFSMASSVAMASSITGEDLKTSAGSPPATQADLLKAVEQLRAQSLSTADALRSQQKELQKSIDDMSNAVLKIGAENEFIPGNNGFIYKLH